MPPDARQAARIVSIQIGVPIRLVDERGQWETSFVREPSPERRRLFVTHLEPGSAIDLVDRPHPDVSVALINDFCHGRNRDVAAAAHAAACPLLEPWWQRLVVVRAGGGNW